MRHVVLVAGALPGMSCVSAAADLPRCDKSVKIESFPDPEYPGGEHPPEGTVVVEVTVDASGKVTDTKVVESTNKRLNDVSLNGAVRWRFTPPKQPCRHRVPITFRVG